LIQLQLIFIITEFNEQKMVDERKTRMNVYFLLTSYKCKHT